jgi:hypothetical protein
VGLSNSFVDKECSAFKTTFYLHEMVKAFFLKARVTRSGDFSPVGRLFALDNVLRNTKVAQFFGYFFPR